jgi:hypothetical protein
MQLQGLYRSECDRIDRSYHRQGTVCMKIKWTAFSLDGRKVAERPGASRSNAALGANLPNGFAIGYDPDVGG